MFQKVNVKILGLVQNMNVYICPKCGEKSHIFGEDGALKLASELGLNMLADVPLNMQIRKSCDSGQPIVVSNPEDELALIYRDLAEKVTSSLPPWEDPFFSKV
ncbi:iron-sulfur protein NUBPL-like [Stegodyphus dumicola]|uniref:iron-sulfur protein NUBPL-like n=1 Tax=Stegodyphus dumicola TaxID=202533 RepID=UPI0015B03886|nr:iron-sulfur protein NUBPL-like [Stegodyphus dumicola]